jgi:hypothetical protein
VTPTAADLVIEELAARELDLKEANRQLVDLVADLAFENRLLRLMCMDALRARCQRDAQLKAVYRTLNALQATLKHSSVAA